MVVHPEPLIWGVHSAVFMVATERVDQEPAIVDLLRAVAKLRGNNRTTLENSPVGDSAGNGFAENAVQRMEKLLRVHKLDLERKWDFLLGDEDCRNLPEKRGAVSRETGSRESGWVYFS